MNTAWVAIFIVLTFTNPYRAGAQKINSPPFLNEEWSKDYEPFRIAGNLYYVGTYDLASYLITTVQGNILINTGLSESVPMIKAHVEKLGFKFSDTKILLATHAHYDHVGGMAEIKKMTGAKMFINERDAPVLADGGNSDYLFGGKGSTFAPLNTDEILHEHDTVKFGGMKIFVLHHPGHTKGACSFLFDVKDKTGIWRVLIANMPSMLDEAKPGMSSYPDIARDYGSTIASMSVLSFDIWLASHASQFNLHGKHKPEDVYAPQAFSDRAGYDTRINGFLSTWKERFDKEQISGGSKNK